jgi:integrase
MGRNKKSSGLIRRGRIWYIQKQIRGRIVRRSTGTDQLEEAEMILARVIEEERQASIFGVRPKRIFEEAAARFILEHQHKRSLKDDIGRLKNLLPFIGHLWLEHVHMGTLRPWLESRLKAGRTAGTINHGLQVVRRILHLSARRWRDENGLTWLAEPAEIVFLPNRHKRQPMPLTWAEEDRLFAELPPHLRAMALFAVNTGCRDSEICNLRWAWEVPVPELHLSVFVIPGENVKNGLDRLVVLNRIASEVVAAQRGGHATHVFHYKGRPVRRIYNSAWMRAREKAGLPGFRVHDLKHTFGRRLRAAGVSFEDRQDLLGHKSQRMTTHYSAADLTRLIEAANRVCGKSEERPDLVVLRRGVHKTHPDTRILAAQSGLSP